MKRPEEYALEYAGFWLRLGATVLDLVFLFLLLFFLNTIFSNKVNFPNSFAGMLATGFIFLLLKIAYFITFWVWQGQTPGKMIVGIKVIRTDSSPLDWTHAFVRYLGYFVCVLTVFLGFIWIAFDPKKQGLHDKLADTYVVKLPVRQVIFTDNYVRSRVG